MQPSTTTSLPPSNLNEPEELKRFREEWKAELQSKTTDVVNTSSELPKNPVDGKFSGISSSVLVEASTESPLPPTFPVYHPALTGTSIAPSAILTKALITYRDALDQEQAGRLDDALLLYRKAFRLDSNVDRAYHREEMLFNIQLKNSNPLQLMCSSTDGHLKEFAAHHLQKAFSRTKTLTARTAVLTGTMASIIAAFPQVLYCEPEIEGKPIFISTLPDELLLIIMRKLDHTSLERFASVNRKMRVLSLDPVVWRDLVAITYKPPQITHLDVMVEVAEHYLYDYRRIYIEYPRVRFDGVYIATCHYVRPGLSENNSWVNVTHLVTYHRYLRFFHDGQALSLLANEEHNPQHVVSLLKPTLRMKGLFIGRWDLKGTTVHLSNLLDASEHTSLPDSHFMTYPPILTASAHSHNPAHTYAPVNVNTTPRNANSVLSSTHTRYVFDMTLELRSRPLGRWNRLDIRIYDSMNTETGDVVPVQLKHERPFWFSKVKSYSAV